MRIGLIPMSGVRIRSEKLVNCGVTLPGFVARGKVIAALPSLGLITLASHIPDGHEIRYIEVDQVNSEADLDFNFDLVLLTSFSAMAFEMYRVADMYRAHGVKVMIGGLHATMQPAEAKEHCDSVCIGEGDLLFPQMLKDFEKCELKPYYREEHPGAYDIAQAPVPRYDLLKPENYNRITIQTQRGCPHVCPFCASTRIFGRRYRQKPVENVIRELEAIEKFWPRPFIEFADDNTFVDKKWGKELLKQLIPHKIRWFTETDIAIAEDDEVVDLLYRSGCEQVLIGLETTNPEAIGDADLTGWKKKKFEKYRGAISKLQSAGVTVNGCFVIGWDSDDKGCFERVREFAIETNLLETQVTILTPMPGTEMYKKLQLEGRLLEEKPWDKCTLFDVTFTPAKMSVEDVEEGMIYLFRELYNEQMYTRRKRHYMNLMKELPEEWIGEAV